MRKKSLNQKIFNIAIPTFFGFFGMVIFECVDIFWIGRVGTTAVAAVGSAAFLEWITFSFMALTCTGCSTLVAQFHGASRRDEGHKVINDSFWLSLLLSLLIMLLLFFTNKHIFHFMGLNGETSILANEYFTILILGFPVLYIYALQGHIFNAYGDTKTSTLIMALSIIINIILDPILIFGHLGLPELGIRGASISSVISQLVGVIIRYHYLKKRNYIGPINFSDLFPIKYFKRLLQIGVPSCTTNLVWTMVFPLLSIIITKFGMEPLAGLNVATRLESIPYFLSVGMAVAINTLVGQSYGQGNKQEVWIILKRGTIIISVLLLPISLLFIICPDLLVGVINKDPVIIRHSSDYLRIIGYFELFLGWEIVIEGGFNGLGNTRPYMLLRAPLTLARFPLAYLLAFNFDLGVLGVWWAMSTTTFVKGTGLLVLFLTNKTNKRLLASEESLLVN